MNSFSLPRSSITGIEFPALPQPLSAQVLGLEQTLGETQWASPQTLQRGQAQQIHALVEHARHTTPWYRQHYASTSPSAADSERFFDWFTQQPLLDRKFLESAPGPTWSESPPTDHGAARPHKTSGSSGRDATVLGNTLVSLFWHALTLRDHRWHARDFGERMLAIRSGRSAKDPAAVTEQKDWGGPVGLCYGGGASTLAYHRQPIAALTDLLVARRPAYLEAYPALADALAQQCIHRGIELPELRGVAAYGEPVEDAARTACRAAWNIPVHDRYSAEEVGYIALQCPDHQLLHVQSESVYLELLDSNDQPAPPGQPGRVVVTALHNFASPLLRYEIGDWAIAGPLCACGRGLPVLQRVLGRGRNCLHLPAGKMLWPHEINTKLWRQETSVTDEQFIQDPSGAVELKIVSQSPLTPIQDSRLRQLLQVAVGDGVPISVSRHTSIERSPNGKFERIISQASL